MLPLKNEYDFEHAPCGYLSFLPDGTLVYLNQTLLRWLGSKREDLAPGTTLDDITAKGTRLYLQMFVYPQLRMQGYINELSIDIIARDGHPVSCLFNATAVANDDGSIKQVHAILFSIAERKQYEREILEAKKTAEALAEQKERILQAQRRIVSILGHDTKAPLFSIRHIIKFGVDGTLNPEEVSAYFELISNQLDATLILLNEVMSWSNALFKNKEEKEALFRLHAVTTEVFDLLEGNALAKGLYLKNDVSPALRVGANKAIFTFIIRNLVNNAIKFTKKGGVTVSAQTGDQMVSFEVSDTGVGMTVEQLTHFKTGQLGSAQGTDNEQGSSMGMVLINEFLLQIKGSLQVTSRPGKGTSIRVSVPCGHALYHDVEEAVTGGVH